MLSWSFSLCFIHVANIEPKMYLITRASALFTGISHKVSKEAKSRTANDLNILN